ncbi:MAG: PEP-CTERM sorting domain-containing protein [Phycisphaerales bacterium]|nr:PEP-CTERM sorting domain-containing protein [Phycisphaerales bacterium]
MSKFVFMVAAFAATAGSALGAGTITSGTASYSWVGAWSSSTSGNGTFVTGTGISDQLFKNTWYYRSSVSLSSQLFSFPVTPASEVVSGDTATITYNDQGTGTAGVARFNAVFTVKIVQVAEGQARIDTRLRITNNSNTQQTFQFLNLVDLDLLGGTNAISRTGDTAIYTAGANTGRHTGFDFSFATIGSGTNVQTAVNGSANLNNGTASGGGTSTDRADAFQWTRTLGVGASTDIYSSFAINTATVPAPGTFAMLALGGLVAGRRRR